MAGEEPECPVCYRPFNRCSRAPRRLTRCPCPHALCTRCLRELAAHCAAQAQGSAAVACPFCRAPAPLPPGGVTSLPLDLELWERLGAELKDEDEAEDGDKDKRERPLPKRSIWRAARKMLIKALSAPARSTRRPAIDHEELRDLALMNCYIM
ncbi:RING finger protein 227 [Rhinatrema bivittatum]|uniref:RING finger protein 227 n=1 Tax=Rhinatrema bivittatum TaxID=194408 RepID=UPI001129F22C|nr:RING finger protein 227 [Rhinatrema bivittatum]